MNANSGAGLQPVRRQTTSDRVASAIRTHIDEQLQPGDRLPPERQLCQMLGVGRTTLREALRILQSEGHVTVRAGSGAYVTVPGETTPFAQWPERLDATVDGLLQVRLLLEPPAAALAAAALVSRQTKEQALQAPLDAMAQAAESGQLEHRVAADFAFHNAVAKLAGNAVLFTTLEHLSTLLMESRRVSLSYEHRVDRVQDAHGRVCAAILARDADAAAREMALHLATFGRDMGIGGVPIAVPSAPMRVVTVEELLDETEHSDEEIVAEDDEGIVDDDAAVDVDVGERR